MNEMRHDAFRAEFGPAEFQEFLDMQNELEAQSKWILNVKGMSADAVASEMDVLEYISDPSNQIPKDLLDDTVDHSGLVLNYDIRRSCLRECALPSLQKRVGLWGPGYNWLSKNNLAGMLTEAFTGVRGVSKLLLRAQKVAAVLSNSYEYMPISSLLTTVKEMEQQFGYAEFMGGSIAHDRTYAKFRFPDCADEVTDAYNKALIAAGRPASGTLTPVIEFRSSDTGVEAARLIPFLEADASKYSLIPLMDGVSVNHQNSANMTCMEKFRQDAMALFAQIGSEIQSLIPAMLSHDVHHPGNAVIGICNYLRIPQKWGGLVEEDVKDMYPVGCRFLDLFVALTEVTSYAVQEGYSPQSMRIINLEEGLAKLAKNRQLWSRFDLPGTVNWVASRSNQ